MKLNTVQKLISLYYKLQITYWWFEIHYENEKSEFQINYSLSGSYYGLRIN